MDLQFSKVHLEYQYPLFDSTWHSAARARVHHERGQAGSPVQSQHMQGLWPACRVTWPVTSPVPADNGKVMTQVHGQGINLVNMSERPEHSTKAGITPVQLRQESRAPMLSCRVNVERRWEWGWNSAIRNSWCSQGFLVLLSHTPLTSWLMLPFHSGHVNTFCETHTKTQNTHKKNPKNNQTQKNNQTKKSSSGYICTTVEVESQTSQ